MQYLIQLLVSGLAIGAIYGLIAMGFAVIYKSTGLVNFAQGEMTMITAYIAWTISTTVSGNVVVVALGAILAAVVLGLVIERLVILSPSSRVPAVSWKRSRITVHPREGWRPNTVYRVELLPGVADLRNNRSQNGRVITFTTGAPLPTATSAGARGLAAWT